MKDQEYQNIIIRMPNWVGDIVMATPILEDVRNRYPDASITAMCKFPLCELLYQNPFIDELFCFEKVPSWLRRIQDRGLIQKLRMGKYDLGILLTNSMSSAWWFMQGKVKTRLGFKNGGRSFLLTHPISFPKKRDEQHLTLTYKALLAPLGILKSQTTPKLFVEKQEVDNARAILKTFDVSKENMIIGVNPGASYGSSKCWPKERFIEMTTQLLEKHESARVVFFGDSSQLDLIKEITDSFDHRVINLSGKTSLRELMALISICNVFVSNDSGPMHIADALQIPLVALFGSTSAILTGPSISRSVVQKKVSCSPCFKRECPIDFRCMKNIKACDVIKEIEKWV